MLKEQQTGQSELRTLQSYSSRDSFKDASQQASVDHAARRKLASVGLNKNDVGICKVFFVRHVLFMNLSLHRTARSCRRFLVSSIKSGKLSFVFWVPT